MELEGNFIYLSEEEQKEAGLPAKFETVMGPTLAHHIMQSAEIWKRQAVEAKVQEMDWNHEASFSSPEDARQYFDEHMHNPEIYRRWEIGRQLAELTAPQFANEVELFAHNEESDER